MKKKIAIYGGGGLGREVLSLIKTLPELDPIGFYDDGVAKGTAIKNLTVLGGMDDLLQHDHPLYLVIAIGDPQVKMKIVGSLSQNTNIDYPVLIHPAATLQESEYIRIGRGSVICPGVILTTDVEIHEHVLLNLNCTIGHDVKIGAFSSIMPGVNVAGEVVLGEGVFVGSGANILNRLTLDAGSRVGAGAVVTRNVKHGETVVGIPAGPIVKSV